MADIATAFNRKDALASSRRQDQKSTNFSVPQKTENSKDDYIEQRESGQAAYREKLSKARMDTGKRIKSVKKGIRKIKTAVFSLKEVDFSSDMPLFAAFGAALLKDLLDLVDFETVILPMLFSVLCSIFIFMMLLLAKALEKRKVASRLIVKGLTILGGSLADGIPGLSFFPIETITMSVIYFMVLYERAKAKEVEQEAKKELESQY